MGIPWKSHPSWELVEEASDAADRDVARLLLEADAAELTETRNAQLATFVLSMVALDAVERIGVEPALHAGHSLGEYSALVGSGSVSFADGVNLVAERGNAMQAAADSESGTMAAVLGLDDDKVELACGKTDGDVWVANYNAPGQVVIAGSPEGIAACTLVAKDLGAKRVMGIKVGGAFHTPFMSAARDRLRKALAETEFRIPNRPVVANVDAEVHDDPEDWPSLLGAQLTSPVRWRQSLHTLHEAGATVFLELGPGTVLSGMARRSIPDAARLSVSDPGALDTLLEQLGSAHGERGRAERGRKAAEGEHLFAHERLVVSPGNGVFQPVADISAGSVLSAGDLLGHIGPDEEVRSPFTGALQGMLAMPGERVTTSQPVAWLRTDS